jgi:putative transposase
MDSYGRQIENPRFYERSLERIRVELRKLSRKIKDSKNWVLVKVRLARIYEKLVNLVNQRDYFLHKLSFM